MLCTESQPYQARGRESISRLRKAVSTHFDHCAAALLHLQAEIDVEAVLQQAIFMGFVRQQVLREPLKLQLHLRPSRLGQFRLVQSRQDAIESP